MATKYYTDTRREAPNLFASFANSYLRMRVPLAMEVFRARLAAADPKARLELIAKLNEQRAALLDSWSQVQRDSEKAGADIIVAAKTLAATERTADATENAAAMSAEANVASTYMSQQGETSRLRAKLQADRDLAQFGAEQSVAEGMRLTDDGQALVRDAVRLQEQLLTDNPRTGTPKSDAEKKAIQAQFLAKMEGWKARVMENPNGAERQAIYNALRNTAVPGGDAETRDLMNQVFEGIVPGYRSVDLEAPPAPDVAPPPRVGVRARTGEIKTGEEVGRDAVGLANAAREGGLGASTSSSSSTRTSGRVPAEFFAGGSGGEGSGSGGAPPTEEERRRQELLAARPGMDQAYQRQLADLDRQIAEQQAAVGRGMDDLGGFYDPLPGSVRARPPRQPASGGSPGRARAEDFMGGPTKDERQAERARRKALRKAGKDRYDATGSGAEGTAFQPPSTDAAGSQLGRTEVAAKGAVSTNNGRTREEEEQRRKRMG